MTIDEWKLLYMGKLVCVVYRDGALFPSRVGVVVDIAREGGPFERARPGYVWVSLQRVDESRYWFYVRETNSRQDWRLVTYGEET